MDCRVFSSHLSLQRRRCWPYFMRHLFSHTCMSLHMCVFHWGDRGWCFQVDSALKFWCCLLHSRYLFNGAKRQEQDHGCLVVRVLSLKLGYFKTEFHKQESSRGNSTAESFSCRFPLVLSAVCCYQLRDRSVLPTWYTYTLQSCSSKNTHFVRLCS